MMSEMIEELVAELADAIEELVYARETSAGIEEKQRVNKASDALRTSLAAKDAEIARLKGALSAIAKEYTGMDGDGMFCGGCENRIEIAEKALEEKQ